MLLDFTFKQLISKNEFTNAQKTYINNKLLDKKVNILQQTNSKIDFDVTFFDMHSFNLMVTIDKGSIEIKKIKGRNYIVYIASYKRMFYLTSAFALLFGILDLSIGTFFVYCIFLFGLNLLISYFRQDTFFTDLTKGIKKHNKTI